MLAVSASPLGTSRRALSFWLKTFISTMFFVAGLVLYALPTPASAGSCTSQTATKTDPTTGWSWSTIWYCGNRGGASMYADANYNQAVATMNSTNSWFVCWRAGAQHSGNNNIWYYSLGDVPAGVWGFMPAVDVWTSTDPWPGMAQCPSSSTPPPPAPPPPSAGKIIGNPVVIANADGRLELFAIHSLDHSVWHTWQAPQGGGWAQWKSLGGWADQLSVARNGDGRLELFVRNSDGAVHNISQISPGGAWGGWGNLGGGVLTMPTGQSAIAAAQNLDGHLEIFVIGTDNALHHKWQTCPGCGWSGWDHQGGWLDQIAVSRNIDGRLEVFVRGSDLAMHHKVQTAANGPGLSDWYHRGGVIDQIAVQQNLYGELETFVVGSDHAIWHNWQTSPSTANWYGWATLDPWLDRISAAQLPDGRLEIFGRGSDAALYHKYQLQDMSAWTGWIYEGWGGGGIDAPVVASNVDGRLEVFARGADGLVYHKSQLMPQVPSTPSGMTGWTNWASLGAPGLCINNSRPLLTCGEIANARQVFGDRIDYDRVGIYRQAYFPGQPDSWNVTPNGNIYSPLDDGDFSHNNRTDVIDFCSQVVGGDATLASENLETCTFIHEMTHVWQWQNGWSTPALGFEALIVGIIGEVGGPNPYEFTYDPNKPFVCYTIEQQGQLAVDIYFHPYKNNIPPNNVTNSALAGPGQCP